MNQHAMRYVEMARQARIDLGDSPLLSHREIRDDLDRVAERLVVAESELVAAYGDWRDIIKRAADAGSAKAADYLERTTWDLT